MTYVKLITINFLLLLFFITSTSTAISARGNDEIVIIATGDIMPSHRVLPFVKKHGYSYPYLKTSKILATGDLVIGNLETPLIEDGKPFENKKYTFKAPLESANALKLAGFTHLSLANNHMMDYGEEGLVSTLNTLDAQEIKYSGAGIDLKEARRSSFTKVKGKKFAFLSYSNTFPTDFYAKKNKAGTAPGYRNYIINDIKKAKLKADYLIIAFHWGAELMQTPKDYQKDLAHLAIDSGADIVLGHHPHVLQGVEYYDKGIIFYSLGNFAFGSYSKSTTDSIIAKIILKDDGIFIAEAIPINVNNFEVHFKPIPLEGDKGKKVITHLKNLSKSLGSNVIYADGLGRIKKTTQLTLKHSEVEGN